MFDTIASLIPRDADYPERARRLDLLTRFLQGRQYDVLPYEFHDERGAGGEYVPLRRRRPRAVAACHRRRTGPRRPR